jgi:hypothetical protein
VGKAKRRVGALFTAASHVQTVLWIGSAAVASAIAATVLNVADAFEWWIFSLFAAGFLGLAYVALRAAMDWTRELRLIPMSGHGETALANAGDGKYQRRLHAVYYVTNLSDDRPTRLVSVELPKLGLRGSAMPQQDWGSGDYDTDPFLSSNMLAAGETGRVSFSFYFPANEHDDPTWRVKARIVVTDRFGRRHKTRRISFQPKG